MTDLERDLGTKSFMSGCPATITPPDDRLIVRFYLREVCKILVSSQYEDVVSSSSICYLACLPLEWATLTTDC
jgi:hypothetical protein